MTLLAQATVADPILWMPLINAGAAVVCVGLVVWIQVWGGPAERKAFTEELEKMRASIVTIAAHNSEQRELQRKHDDKRWDDQRKFDHEMWVTQREHDKRNRDQFAEFIVGSLNQIREEIHDLRSRRFGDDGRTDAERRAANK